ncbi:MliC family protein [Tritonibacter mobilis]|uniref:MliC family protein n=1 Tax=Tritonibacter mobilis TaxID=379347 RepID=UPI000806A801|nr:MliC family protein [Tritonibacter mobilis]
MFRFILAVPVAALAMPALAETAVPADTTLSTIQTEYTCERGVRVPVVFINTEAGESLAIVQLDGQQVVMTQVVSGSGMRYRSRDENQPYELHGKGNDALIAYGPEEDADLILRDCVSN